MRKNGTISTILALSLLTVSCLEPMLQYSAIDEAFTRDTERTPWKKIAILPFMGDPALRSVVGEWFAFEAGKHGLFEIVGPGAAVIALKEKGIAIGEADLPLDAACAAGRALGVDAVIVGSVQRHDYIYITSQGQATWKAGVSLVDVATGRVLATSLRQVLNFTTVQTTATITAALLLDDTIPALYAAAGRPWTPRKKAEQPAEETATTPW